MSQLENQLQQELEESNKYEEVKKSIAVLLSSKHGRNFIEYLFENFMVGEAAPKGLNDRDLIDYTSMLRVGNSIYKLVLEAEPTLTGQLIATIEVRRQDAEKTRIENERNSR